MARIPSHPIASILCASDRIHPLRRCSSMLRGTPRSYPPSSPGQLTPPSPLARAANCSGVRCGRVTRLFPCCHPLLPICSVSRGLTRLVCPLPFCRPPPRHPLLAISSRARGTWVHVGRLAAGVMAAAPTTPCDVVKTRMQVLYPLFRFALASPAAFLPPSSVSSAPSRAAMPCPRWEGARPTAHTGTGGRLRHVFPSSFCSNAQYGTHDRAPPRPLIPPPRALSRARACQPWRGRGAGN